MVNCLCAHERVILVFISIVAAQINTKITLEWAHKQFTMRVHISFHSLYHITNPQMMLKTMISAHHLHVSLARFTFCWWRQLLMMSQWPDNCDTITWKVISNSLDINFIFGDIHGRVRKIYITYSTVMAKVKHKSNFEFTQDTAYLNLEGNLWDVNYILEKIYYVLTSLCCILFIAIDHNGFWYGNQFSAFPSTSKVTLKDM